MNIISSGKISLVHSMRNLLHGIGKQTFYFQPAGMPRKADLHQLRQRFSFSLLLSSINSYILLSVVKYVKVVRFNKEDGILW